MVLCLVGLDYFSTLAYLPSIAFAQLDKQGGAALAPLAGLGIVLVTLLAALPVYWYVVGRSPHGKGGIGLLEERAHGWGGKILILVLLGFVATDFVLTRSLSVSDASAHILANPYYQGQADTVEKNREAIREALPASLQGRFFDFWNEQLVMTVLLTVIAFALYFFLVRSIGRGFLGVAVGVVGLYLLMNLVLLGSCLAYLAKHPELFLNWEKELRPQIGDIRSEAGNAVWLILLLALGAFPSLAIGLSGFELSMASAPLVRGSSTDNPEHPRCRIRRTRVMMVLAAVVMSVLVLSSTLVVTLLVPRDAILHGDEVSHRSLAYLAHGGSLANNAASEEVSPLFGDAFGTLYDFSTVLILCLAGASATIGMKDLVPEFLGRFGMQMVWAHKIGVITHLFNVVILVVTIWFKASVSDQLWAYAASVLALLFGASLAATLDVRHRWHGAVRLVMNVPFTIIMLLFAVMGVLIVYQGPSGVFIPLLFAGVVLVTAFVSRWMRSTELRFEGFEHKDEVTRQRWEEICKLEFQVLVPHDPTHETIERKEAHIRERHRLGPEVPIIFIEACVGDPSDFMQKPLMEITHEGGEEVIRVSHCTSIAHVITAIGLAFREVGQPPEIHFGWAHGSPMAANLQFLLFGHGNIPWMVHELLRKAEPNPARRPRVIVG
jgi:hypothetical protein